MADPKVVEIVLIILGLAVFFYLFRQLTSKSIDSAIDGAKSAQNPEEIVKYIRAQPFEKRENLWDQALTSLWQSYDRELAAQVLLLALAPREKEVVEGDEVSIAYIPSEDSEIKILHYWVNQILQIEPLVANTYFTKEFLERGYRADLAGCCGRRGCCG